VRLREKGGKHYTVPCRHALAEALHAYIDAAGIKEDRKGFLFLERLNVIAASGHAPSLSRMTAEPCRPASPACFVSSRSPASHIGVALSRPASPA
jgi:hypothetical protein